jgi:DNA-binding PadR family transcriptional regulator
VLVREATIVVRRLYGALSNVPVHWNQQGSLKEIVMSTKHALLGLLLDRPDYRYRLGDRLRERLGPTWDINSGHLYQTVERLERDGFIERMEDPGERRTDRLPFAITTSGVDEFERWFEEDSSKARLIRRPLLVKITLAGPRRLGDALAQIDAYERCCAAQLKDLSHAYEEVAPDPDLRVGCLRVLPTVGGSVGL